MISFDSSECHINGVSVTIEQASFFSNSIILEVSQIIEMKLSTEFNIYSFRQY